MIRRVITGLYHLSLQGFPFGPLQGPKPTEIEKVRRRIRPMILSGYPVWTRPILWLWMVITWPLVCIVDGVFWGSLGLPKMPMAERINWIWKGMVSSASPIELFDVGIEASVDTIFSSDLKGLYAFLNKQDGPDWIADKRTFAAFCDTHDLPAPELFEIEDKNNLNKVRKHTDLVIKKRFGNNARGQKYLSGSADLSEHNISAENELVQRRVYAQPSAEWIGVANAPIELRVVTARNLSGDAETLLSVASLVQGNHRLETAFELSTETVKLEGIVTINMIGVAALADKLRSLHASDTNVTFLGWDILFDGDDFWVLEANTNLSLVHLQHLTARPIGKGPFARYILERI